MERILRILVINYAFASVLFYASYLWVFIYSDFNGNEYLIDTLDYYDSSMISLGILSLFTNDILNITRSFKVLPILSLFKPRFYYNVSNSFFDLLVYFILVFSNLVWMCFNVDNSLTFNEKLVVYSNRLGVLSYLNICITLLFTLKNTMFHRSYMHFNTNNITIKKFHIFTSYLAFFEASMHTFIYIYLRITQNSIQYYLIPWLSFNFKAYTNFHGLLAYIAFVIIVMTSFECIRERFHMIFSLGHYLYIFFIVFCIIHSSNIALYLFIPVTIAFIYDKLLSLIAYDTQASITRISNNLLRIDFFNPENNPYWVNIQFPEISYEYHPFSVIKSKDYYNATIFMSKQNRWTKKIFNESLNKYYKINTSYTHLLYQYYPFDSILFIVSGTGLSSVLTYLLSNSNSNKQITVIWIIRDIEIYVGYYDYIEKIQKDNNYTFNIYTSKPFNPLEKHMKIIGQPNKITNNTFVNIIPFLLCVVVYTSGVLGWIISKVNKTYFDINICNSDKYKQDIFNCIYRFYLEGYFLVIFFGVFFGFLCVYVLKFLTINKKFPPILTQENSVDLSSVVYFKPDIKQVLQSVSRDTCIVSAGNIAKIVEIHCCENNLVFYKES